MNKHIKLDIRINYRNIKFSAPKIKSDLFIIRITIQYLHYIKIYLLKFKLLSRDIV